MKKILTIALIISILVLTGCVNLDKYVTKDKYSKLEEDRDTLKSEIEQHRVLISSLNNLLKNVYYGYASNTSWESDGFTAFSMEYKNKFYLVTAGHAVHYKDKDIDTGVYTYFKFKANFSDKWIYPKLLDYKNRLLDREDYAIFYSNDIKSGLEISKDSGSGIDIVRGYRLGSEEVGLNIIRSLYAGFRNGESGSPMINLSGKVVGIVTSNAGYTPIEIVTEAIDSLE